MAHVFISYLHENEEDVKRLCNDLEARGVNVWLDREDINVGLRWKQSILRAIRKGDFFIACFSKEYNKRDKTYMNEELTIAIEELRQRPTDRVWFIPVKLNQCEIPDRDIGAGETLGDLQYVKLYHDWNSNIQKVIKTINETVTPSNQLSNPWLLEQKIKTLQEHTERILSDKIKSFYELSQNYRKSDAMKKSKKLLENFDFNFDGQFTVIDSNRIVVFHKEKEAIGRPYTEVLEKMDKIFKEHMIGKNKGIIKWIDDLSSNYELYAGNVDWIRFNISPFSYFKPWDWYIIVEAHEEIHGLEQNQITNLQNYFQKLGWLRLDDKLVLTRFLTEKQYIDCD